MNQAHEIFYSGLSTENARARAATAATSVDVTEGDTRVSIPNGSRLLLDAKVRFVFRDGSKLHFAVFDGRAMMMTLTDGGAS